MSYDEQTLTVENQTYADISLRANVHGIAAPENDESMIVDEEKYTAQEPENGQTTENTLPRVKLEKIPKDFTGDPLAIPSFMFKLDGYVYEQYDCRSRGRRWVKCVGKVVGDG